MKRFMTAVAIFFLVLVAAFFNWRRVAPDYQGQNLHVEIPADTEVELLVLGDMGTGDALQAEIAEAMNQYCEGRKIAAVIFLGDNFYPHGVKTVDDEQWESKFRRPYSLSCLQKLPFYALLGNHDYKGNPKAQIEYKGQNPSWFMPHRFYDIHFGKLLNITMLDTNILDLCGISTRCTLDFLMESLKEGVTQFRVVAGHHPVASSSGKYPRKFQGNVMERVLCNRAHYYLNGHSHHLEHLSSGACKTPLDFFVVGGGGADLYELSKWQKETKFALSTHGFMSLHANFEALTFTFYDKSNKELYKVIKRKDEEIQRTEKPPTQ